MEYDAYAPDSTRLAKSGSAYRVLGHDAATYYQYAIYVSLITNISLPDPCTLSDRATLR